MKRLFSILLILCLLPGILSGALTGSSTELNAEAAGAGSKSGILTVADPTPEEIIAAYNQYQQPGKRFAVAPAVSAPYAAGALDQEYINASEQYLNLYRMVAKLPPVQNEAAKNELAQYGAVLVAANNVLAHIQDKPADMSEDFFQKAYTGSNVSNISSYNYQRDVEKHGWDWVEDHKISLMIPYALKFQIRDFDKVNYQSLGHRRYLLSPYLQTFGVGSADAKNAYNYYYLITHAAKRWPADELVENPNFDFVAWPPSGNCPTELMEKNFPWHITLNESRYVVQALTDANGFDTEIGNRAGIVITVTCMSDGRVWTFDQNSPDGSAIEDPRSYNAPYFYVDKHSRGYGPIREHWVSENMQMRYFSSNALIFRPDFEDNSPFTGVYNVRVTGLKTVSGSAAELNYNVNFFRMKTCEHKWNAWKYITEPSCTTGGERTHMCIRCQETETEAVPALGHKWSVWSEAQAPSCTEEGVKEMTCSRCGEKKTGSIPVLGHDWERVSVTSEASCLEDGAQELRCRRCQAVETQVIPALGHDWEILSTQQEPSCTEDGVSEARCKRCGESETITIPAFGHDWDEGVVTREPTQQAEGERLYTCLRCGETKTEALPWFQFEDVSDPGKYYYKAVYWAYRHNPRVTGGTDATHFSPNEPCKREQIVSFLYAAFGKQEHHQTRSPFLDVEKGKYYYNAVLWAYEKKVAGGVSDQLFGVGKACTRAQAVTFLWVAAGKPNPTITENPFTDVQEGRYFYKPVLWALENKITSGTSATTFGISSPCTRGQIVTFLYKVLGN